MKKIKIGIPRAFAYHRYGVLWKQFFQRLGCKLVLSPETNKEIIDIGKKYTVDACCISYKIYIGHIMYLSDKCDYVLIPRICDYGKKDKVCPRFNTRFDNIKDIIPRNKIIGYNIEHTKLSYEILGFLKMGLKITKNPIKIITSYIMARKKQKQYDITKENEEKNKLRTKQKKILIISYFYNIRDKYVSNYLIEYLNRNNITILYADCLNKKIAASFSEYYSDTLYWKYSKEIIGALYYYINQIDGVIFISAKHCHIDPLINNIVILKKQKLPILKLMIDENNNEAIIEPELARYIDTIKEINQD